MEFTIKKTSDIKLIKQGNTRISKWFFLIEVLNKLNPKECIVLNLEGNIKSLLGSISNYLYSKLKTSNYKAAVRQTEDGLIAIYKIPCDPEPKPKLNSSQKKTI